MRTRKYYDNYWSERGFNPETGLYGALERLLDRVVDANLDCIDVGCGDGRTSGTWIQRRAKSYVGFDVSPAAVAEARELGLDARVIEDARELPLANDSIDVAVVLEVLEHLYEPFAAVTEIRRVLRPGGLMLITVPNVAHWRQRVELTFGRWNPYGDDQSAFRPWRDPHVRFFTLGALRRMLLEAGFEIELAAGHSGPLLREIPFVRRAVGGRESGRIETWAVGRRPSLLARRLHLIARKGS